MVKSFKMNVELFKQRNNQWWQQNQSSRSNVMCIKSTCSKNTLCILNFKIRNVWSKNNDLLQKKSIFKKHVELRKHKCEHWDD
jgi:FtsZ-binding cell division protein ZapB